VVGEDSPLRNSVILYTRTEFGDYLGNVGLGEQILRLMQPLHNKKIFISRKLQVTL